MRGSDPKSNLQRAVLLTALALALVPQSPLVAGDVDSARLRASDSEPENWFTLGRDQNQTGPAQDWGSGCDRHWRG
jgi:hypothetical protein